MSVSTPRTRDSRARGHCDQGAAGCPVAVDMPGSVSRPAAGKAPRAASACPVAQDTEYNRCPAEERCNLRRIAVRRPGSVIHPCNRAHPHEPVSWVSSSEPSPDRACGSSILENLHERRTEKPRQRRFHRRRPVPCRLGPQGNQDRRDRDAGSDGDPRGIREGAAAEGRAHHRQPAHDDPDRGAGGDAAGAGRPGALGLVQHLQHPGPCRRRAGRAGHAGVRLQGREPGRLLGLHPPHLRVRRQGRRRRRPEHDPRRRRRRDAADAPGPARREGRLADRQAHQRRRDLPVRRHQGQAGAGRDLVHAQVRRRSSA